MNPVYSVSWSAPVWNSYELAWEKKGQGHKRLFAKKSSAELFRRKLISSFDTLGILFGRDFVGDVKTDVYP